MSLSLIAAKQPWRSLPRFELLNAMIADMTDASTHALEERRLAALRQYAVMDTPAEPEFDDIVAIAAQICNTPMAVISLIDDERTWAKSAVGIDVAAMPREISFCAHVIESRGTFIVGDTLDDPRFADSPLVRGDLGLRFYAAAPIETPDGLAIGALCVFDRVPRSLGPEQQKALHALARQITTMLELRRALAWKRIAEVRHRLILESAVDYAIVTLDLKGFVTSWNEGAHRIFGWTESEMCGRHCSEFFTAEDRAEGAPERELAAAISRGRGSDERWLLRNTGEKFWASGEMVPLTADDDILIGLLKIVRDRSDKRATEVVMRQNETRMRLALEAVDLGTWQANRALDEFTWNDRTRELLAHGPGEAIDYADTFLSRVHADDRDRVDLAVQEAFGDDSSGQLKMDFRTVNPVDGNVQWVQVHGGPIDPLDNAAGFVGTTREITHEKAAEAHRKILSDELEHRVGNTLAVAQAIVSQSLRSVATPAEASKTIQERLGSLGRAHKLLTQTSWKAAPMREVIDAALVAVGARADRINCTGPGIELNARAALALAMVVHELSTNAAKYGALSGASGTVDVDWQIDGIRPDAICTVIWQERDGPIVSTPTRRGFGSDLIETVLASDLGGTCAIEYLPEGVRWTLHAKLGEIDERS